MKIVLVISLFCTMLACSHSNKNPNPEFKKYAGFQSEYIGSRNVEIMLPPNYDPNKKYDVLYMHDGQNVFDPFTAFYNNEWGVDEAVADLMKTGEIRPVIVVAVWNTEIRFQEYMPNKPVEAIQELRKNGGLMNDLLSDEYLKFLVYELKPFVDENFSTINKPENTFIMGSSMGGLISCYALCEYPEVFGGAGCVSTHWPALDGVFLPYVKNNLPNPSNHKFYFDFGTATLDSLYEPYQIQVDQMMRENNYEEDVNWMTRKFEGAKHNEIDWRERVHIPLKFLLKP